MYPVAGVRVRQPHDHADADHRISQVERWPVPAPKVQVDKVEYPAADDAVDAVAAVGEQTECGTGVLHAAQVDERRQPVHLDLARQPVPEEAFAELVSKRDYRETKVCNYLRLSATICNDGVF